MTNMATTRQFLRDYISPKRALGCYNLTRSAISQCSTADLMCDYMASPDGDDCSGNGVCDSKVTGQCTCQSGYRGADCSKPVSVLLDGFYMTSPFLGTQSFFFQYDAGVQADRDFQLVISNPNPFDVYILPGLSQDPSEFNHDIEIKGQTSLKITS